MNNTKTERVKTCPCGQEFECTHHNQKYCPTCREVRYNAAHPLKTCGKCGESSRTISRNHLWCYECRRAAWEEEREQRRTMKARRQEIEREASKPTPKPSSAESESDKSDFMSWYEGLTDEQQIDAYNALISAIKSVRDVITPPTPPTPIDLEEVPAADQDDIDITFASLLADMEL